MISWRDKYVKRLESEIEYYRALAVTERERADRLHDQLLADRGLPPVTTTVTGDVQKMLREQDNEAKKRARESAEMFAEDVDELTLSEDLLAAVTDAGFLKPPTDSN